MRIAFLGLGLIGGSVARALAERPAPAGEARPSMVAWSPRGSGPRAALDAGVIDAVAASVEDAVGGADLVILAGPPPACLGLLDDLATGPVRAALAADAVITDVASTKSALVLRATALGLRFVGGHPMAGRESSGFAAATADLFIERPWVVVPGPDVAAMQLVERLATQVGARVIRMAAAAHDAAVAGISHLPLLAAAALVESVAGGSDAPAPGWADAQRLAATGWRDMTRLARGDVAMGTGIALTNAAPLAARVRRYIAVLEAWAEELERDGGPDAAAVAERLAAARATLEATDR